MDLENIPIPNTIHLHKKTRDILFTDMFKTTLKLSKLQNCKIKTEIQLRQEKVENKAHQAQIKKLQTYPLAGEGKAEKGPGIQKMLNEKENAMQLLKKKLTISSTQLIQGPELTEMEKEKESLNNEMIDCKAKLLKLAEKEKQWKKYMTLVVESEKSLKIKYGEMERKSQEKDKELEGRIITRIARSSE